MLERRINALIYWTTVECYRDKQEQLNAVLSAQFDRNRRLNALKDRLKGNDASAIRSLGDQDRLDGVIDRYEQQLKMFPPRLAEIASQQERLAGGSTVTHGSGRGRVL
jgi:DNA sulfur modification protein DndD